LGNITGHGVTATYTVRDREISGCKSQCPDFGPVVKRHYAAFALLRFGFNSRQVHQSQLSPFWERIASGQRPSAFGLCARRKAIKSHGGQKIIENKNFKRHTPQQWDTKCGGINHKK
jgi:hypothetical protein